ncbi:MAG: hypothetical protein EZS28_018139 [Streblomastix strix]|uniref:Uncharacterized protein n=1 Tax=Streblomastix strix TaxID=222440 RepID=A0A5J4VUI4_9EUKA|nr:MAG: hypothetical protein EZS28_018139 [Streblomastix strix]
MIPPEKLDLIFLQNGGASTLYQAYSVRLVNMEGKAQTVKVPTNSISQIKDVIFNRLEIHNVRFNMENDEAIIDMIRMQKILNFPTQILRTQSSNFPFSGFNASGSSMQSIMSYSNIKAMFNTFATNQYPTWMFPVLFENFDLVIDQRHVVPASYTSLSPMVCGQMFECFVEQDLVSAPSDLYNSLNFQNQSINEGKEGGYYGKLGGGYQDRENIFYNTTLYRESKASKVYQPHKFMLAWKLATDDSFMRGYNSSKMGARTNIQVTLQGKLVEGIVESSQIDLNEKQDSLPVFCATRAYPIPQNASITPQMHYLCDAIIRFSFDVATDPQVLNFEIIGEIGGTMVRSG